MAAQDQALRTNSIERLIDNQNVSARCRMYGESDETISHIVSECKKLAQKQYWRWRHDKVAQAIHWDPCRKLGYDRLEKYYNHQPQPVYESINNKLLWDFIIQTDNNIEHNKPDIAVLDKIEWKCPIIDVACPFDTRVKDKEKENIENYQDLIWELKQIWKLRRVTVVPVIMGALGTVSKDIEKWLAEIGVTCCLESLQRACLLGRARILRKVLDT